MLKALDQAINIGLIKIRVGFPNQSRGTGGGGGGYVMKRSSLRGNLFVVYGLTALPRK